MYRKSNWVSSACLESVKLAPISHYLGKVAPLPCLPTCRTQTDTHRRPKPFKVICGTVSVAMEIAISVHLSLRFPVSRSSHSLKKSFRTCRTEIAIERLCTASVPHRYKRVWRCICDPLINIADVHRSFVDIVLRAYFTTGKLFFNAVKHARRTW